MKISIAHPQQPDFAADVRTCPECSGTLDFCTCGTRPGSLRGGLSDEARKIESEDDARGFEPEDALDRVVHQFVADGDARAVRAGRRARRTLGEMMPGYERQPILILHQPRMAQDACPLCLRWGCNGTNCPPGVASAPTGTACAQVSVPA
ncbi:hypothetical protein ACIQKB_37650 [Streptomyces sp. NPDC092046]|uniref:hypothetical protein n=1 Tax=Streptomyces sp. NPDC092046 TaxID=3366009 RepID=UPI00382479BF